jgi:hypothetical protein
MSLRGSKPISSSFHITARTFHEVDVRKTSVTNGGVKAECIYLLIASIFCLFLGGRDLIFKLNPKNELPMVQDSPISSIGVSCEFEPTWWRLLTVVTRF